MTTDLRNGSRQESRPSTTGPRAAAHRLIPKQKCVSVCVRESCCVRVRVCRCVCMSAARMSVCVYVRRESLVTCTHRTALINILYFTASQHHAHISSHLIFLIMYHLHPGVLVAKVGYFGVKSAKVCRAQRWAPNLLKSVALAPGVLKCGAASTPHRRAPPQKGLRSTSRAKLLKSAPRADQSC